MNKDLDERLIPNGEYRDALNVQVSTSEESDVGTVQNLLGNVKVQGQSFGDGFVCVGSVSDEKNDKLYWFITNELENFGPASFSALDADGIVNKDCILEYRNGSPLATPVFVDIWAVRFPWVGNNLALTGNQNTFTVNNITGIEVGMIVQFVVFGSGRFEREIISITGNTITVNSDYNADVNIQGISIIQKGPIKVYPSYVSPLDGSIFPAREETQLERVLNFRKPFQGANYKSNIITGINIIDDMLFWTDNNSEPKKINIPRSKEGTPSINKHTVVVNEDRNFGPYGFAGTTYFPAREQHVTVIRKSPKSTLSLELNDGRDDSLMYSGIITTADGSAISQSNIKHSTNPTIKAQRNFSGLQVGDNVRIQIEFDSDLNSSFDLAWKDGDVVLLKEFKIDDGGDQVAPQIPLLDWSIRAMITDWSLNKFDGPALVEIEILSIDGTPPLPEDDGILDYMIDIESKGDVIFELKFPRFSYRYKYEDGEYSTFAPWSQTAFLPGGFNYDPKEGWNTGMMNTVKEIILTNFITDDIPEDVVSIDILYKEEISPNIYIVETISPVDPVLSGSSDNYWNLNTYSITSETVKATLASNQLLRTWDNVPVRALAQEVTGNRIVYANYVQGHDLSDTKYKPDFKNSLSVWADVSESTPEKSIKSLREYKLGVVFTDKYGRETPILTSESGGFKVDKKQSINANRLKVGLRGDAPENMEYFKFYIKETSTEYYNIPMDRWYNAEDGNIWLAFPSADRNKIDIDTALFLKKGNEENIYDEDKYKVLAIENEAPRFIKTKRVRIGSVEHDSSASTTTPAATPQFRAIFGDDQLTAGDSNLINAPRVDSNAFSLNYAAGEFANTSISNLETVTDDLYVSFSLDGLRSSNYKVSEVGANRTVGPAGETIPPDSYNITLENSLLDDIDFIFDDETNPSKILDGVKVEFTKEIVEESPRFEGRFFVKIANDGKIKVSIAEGIDEVEWEDSGIRQMIYVLNDDVGGQGTAAGEFLQRVSTEAFNLNYAYGAHTGTRNFITEDFNHANGPQYLTGISSTTYGPWDTQYQTIPGGKSVGGNKTWRAHNARLAYFGRHDFKTHDEKTGGSAFPKPFPTVEKDFTFNDGVWFINRSRARLRTSTADDRLYWPEKYYADEMVSGVSTLYDGFYLETNDEYDGVKNNTDGSTTIDLGFGGVGYKEHDDDWGIGEAWDMYDGDTFNIDNSTHTLDQFFNIGGSGSNYPEQAGFVGKINSGIHFRWKDDPTGTIYKISSQIETQRRCRWGRFDAGNVSGGAFVLGYNIDPNSGLIAPNGGTPRQSQLLLSSPASYHKNFRFDIEPKLSDGWDPIGSGTGAISNGLLLGNTFTAITSGLSYTASEITGFLSSDFDKLEVGMTVKGTDIPLQTKIIAVNTATTSITISGSGPGGSWDNAAEIGFTIRYMGGDLKTGPGSSGQYPYIDVDNIEAACANNGGIKNKFKLHKGMRLALYNTSTATANNNVIIKSIETIAAGAYGAGAPPENRYRIYLTGYEYPLETVDEFGLTIGVGGFYTNPFTSNLTVTFEQVTMNGASNNTEENTHDCRDNWSAGIKGIGAVGYEMIIVQPREVFSEGGILPQDPFVWETEPKEDEGLDIYYEISDNNPIRLDKYTIKTAIPIGSQVESISGEGWPEGGNNLTVTDNVSETGDIITISDAANIGSAPVSGVEPIDDGALLRITRPNGVVFSVSIVEVISETEFKVNNELHKANYRLNWYNCYSFGNGVESNRIRDNFNLPFILNGVKASTTITEDYEEERRKSGLIYSGIYNSTSGVNNLNQFIQAEKITKDINPTYGSIQKLHTRDTDLVVLCEDQVLKILANKDAVFNADGNPNLTATENVLGQAMPFNGEYGISTNPESFASEAYRIYFTDKVRGKVMRLSMDGLTAISDHGMKDWFRDNLKLSNKIIGSYDDKKDEYNITLNNAENYQNGVSVTFKENVKGWVSFKSFVPENAISCANDYYTFKNGELWKHHDENVLRNTFYGSSSDQSTVTVVFNDLPGVIKSFKTLNYEGTQARINGVDPITGLPFVDEEYFNLQDKLGWYVEKSKTNCEQSGVTDFKEKECKWFAYLIGNDVVYDGRNIKEHTFDTSDFNIQGIGTASTITVQNNPGCTDPLAYNYDSNADSDDGSCQYCVYGCMDPTADNYNSAATCNDPASECIIPGCTDESAFNYDSTATEDDGSCIEIILGCIDSTAINYDPLANTDDGSCIAEVLGCIDPTACNYNANANTDDGSCIPIGCSNPIATNYNSLVTLACDDGTCIIPGCTDSTACNYNSSATIDDNSCEPQGCTDNAANNYDPTISSNCDDGSCTYNIDCLGVVNGTATFDICGVCDGDGTSCQGCMDPDANEYDASYIADCLGDIPTSGFGDTGCCTYPNSGCTDPLATNYDPTAVIDDNSCIYPSYGCTNPDANNYDASATIDDGSCLFDCPDISFNLITESNGDQFFELVVETTDTYESWTSEQMFARQNPSYLSSMSSCILKSPFDVRFETSHMPQTPWNHQGPGSTLGHMNLNTYGSGYGAIDVHPQIVFNPWVPGSTKPEWTPLTGAGQNGYSIKIAVTDVINLGPATPGYTSGVHYYDVNPKISIAPSYPLVNQVLVQYTVKRAGALLSNTTNGCAGGDLCKGQDIVYSIGCTIPTATNYNPFVDIVKNDLCEYGSTPGCTDPLANNYNPSAVVDDGSCTYDVPGCTNPDADNYDSSATTNNGSCEFPGCTNTTANNYGWRRSGETYGSNNNLWTVTADGDTFSGGTAKDDGSCILPMNCPSVQLTIVDGNTLALTSGSTTGGFDEGGSEQYWRISIDYSSSDWASDTKNQFINKITLPHQSAPSNTSNRFSLEWYVNSNQANAAPIFPSYTNANIIAQQSYDASQPAKTIYIYVPYTEFFDGTIGPAIDLTVPNASPTSSDPNYHREKINVGFYVDQDPMGSGNWQLCSGAGTFYYWGCTNSAADNYSTQTVAKAGIGKGFPLPAACTWTAGCMDNGSCTEATCLYESNLVPGTPSTSGYDSMTPFPCTTGVDCVAATNYDPNATIDDSSCTYTNPNINGCMEVGWEFYNPAANTPCSFIVGDTSCCGNPPTTLGCTDPSANNYDPAATADDGSCTYDVPGCTDPTATNYSSIATVDDGSCVYTP